MTTISIQQIIQAVEEATITIRSREGFQYNLIDSVYFIQALQKLEKEEFAKTP